MVYYGFEVSLLSRVTCVQFPVKSWQILVLKCAHLKGHPLNWISILNLFISMRPSLCKYNFVLTCLSSSSSLFVQIKIHDANKEQMIKPEQDSKVDKPHLLLPLNRKRKNTEFA